MILKDYRLNSGFSQNEFALLLNVDQTSVSKWESGKSKPRLDKIHEIAVVLGVSDEEILSCFINHVKE